MPNLKKIQTILDYVSADNIPTRLLGLTLIDEPLFKKLDIVSHRFRIGTQMRSYVEAFILYYSKGYPIERNDLIALRRYLLIILNDEKNNCKQNADS